MQYVESSKKERCNIYRRGMTIDSMQCKMKCTEGWPMKVHSIGIYRRERDQCNIQNYKFLKQILQIQLNAEHNSFRVWFERHQCIPTELKRQSLVKICNTGFWWHLLFRAGKSGNCTMAFRKITKGWWGCRENCDPKPTVNRGKGRCWLMFWNIARILQGWKVSI